ncbi:hypothetical protein S83_047683, partial [Arachis hypogaea]
QFFPKSVSFTNATATGAGTGTGTAVTLNGRFVSLSSPIHVRTAFLCEFSSNLILRFEFFPKSMEASPTPPPSELHRRHRHRSYTGATVTLNGRLVSFSFSSSCSHCLSLRILFESLVKQLGILSKLGPNLSSSVVLEVLDMGLHDEAEKVRTEAVISMLVMLSWSTLDISSPVIQKIDCLFNVKALIDEMLIFELQEESPPPPPPSPTMRDLMDELRSMRLYIEGQFAEMRQRQDRRTEAINRQGEAIDLLYTNLGITNPRGLIPRSGP